MKIALCGNPNVGKTTLFNRITRSDAPVGNWHGVTVDIKRKGIKGHKDITVADLPGAYSLTARTAEERITRDQVLFGDHDVIVCVAEVNDLRRNLYILTQILEAGKRAALVVNMMDEARGEVKLDILSRRLAIPVVGASERWQDPTEAIVAAAKKASTSELPYASALLRHTDGKAARMAGLPPAFAAAKMLEGDSELCDRMGTPAAAEAARALDCGACANPCAGAVTKLTDLPARLRYEYIDSLLDGVIEKKPTWGITEKIDKVVLGRFALPIFFVIMAAVFAITFEVGKPLSQLFSRLTDTLISSVGSLDLPEWINSLVCDGVIGGVLGVLGFLPQVVLLFLLTALLQDSGYMSRVAFVTDGFFKRFGISGRAAFSLILGLGCSATAVLSSRGIDGDAARRRTALVTPFCPCSARLAVFTALTAYFGLSGIVVAALYAVGFAAALGVLKLMNMFGKKATETPMLMEIPPYRRPSAKRVARVVLGNVGSFVLRVGTTVLGVSVIMWLLTNFSLRYGFTGGVETSIMNTVSTLIAPVFAPLGFGNWRAVAALISGVAAKETVISVIALLGGAQVVLGSTVSAVSFLIFTCLYVPCVATVAALAGEIGAKGAVISVLMHTVTAYIASLVFYGSATLFSSDLRLFFTVWACVALGVAAAIIISRIIRKQKRSLGSANGKKTRNNLR